MAGLSAAQFSGMEGFEEFIRAEGLRPCPECFAVGELKSGCKFVYCTCKNTFCYLCGRSLTEEQHYSHFQDGPYGTRCYGGAVDKKGYIALPSCSSCEGPGCKRCANDLSTALGRNLEKHRTIEDKRRRRRRCLALGLA